MCTAQGTVFLHALKLTPSRQHITLSIRDSPSLTALAYFQRRA